MLKLRATNQKWGRHIFVELRHRTRWFKPKFGLDMTYNLPLLVKPSPCKRTDGPTYRGTDRPTTISSKMHLRTEVWLNHDLHLLFIENPAHGLMTVRICRPQFNYVLSSVLQCLDLNIGRFGLHLQICQPQFGIFGLRSDTCRPNFYN